MLGPPFESNASWTTCSSINIHLGVLCYFALCLYGLACFLLPHLSSCISHPASLINMYIDILMIMLYLHSVKKSPSHLITSLITFFFLLQTRDEWTSSNYAAIYTLSIKKYFTMNLARVFVSEWIGLNYMQCLTL